MRRRRTDPAACGIASRTQLRRAIDSCRQGLPPAPKTLPPRRFPRSRVSAGPKRARQRGLNPRPACRPSSRAKAGTIAKARQCRAPSASPAPRVRCFVNSLGTSGFLGPQRALRVPSAACWLRLYCWPGRARFDQAMAGAVVEIEAIELLQFLNAAARGLLECRLAVEGVQHDAFQQVAEGQIVKFGERLEHFQQAFFDADTGLHSLNHKLSLVVCRVHSGTNVPWYVQCEQRSSHAFRGSKRHNVSGDGAQLKVLFMG